MISERTLRRFAGKILKKQGLRRVGAEVFLLSPSEMARLERRHLGTRRGVADVLSFPEPRQFPHPEFRYRPLGEVYLNRAVGEKDPARLRYLLVHALLHLAGYSHEKERDRIRMVRREKELCACLRIPHTES